MDDVKNALLAAVEGTIFMLPRSIINNLCVAASSARFGLASFSDTLGVYNLTSNPLPLHMRVPLKDGHSVAGLLLGVVPLSSIFAAVSPSCAVDSTDTPCRCHSTNIA